MKNVPKSPFCRERRRRAGGLDQGREQRGYSLLELTIVVAVLSIVAAIAVPSVKPAERQRLHLGASAVADTLRFAREESRRTSVIHGVSTDLSNNRVRVFRLDETPNPDLRVFDIYHPVSKQLYTVQLDAAPYRGVKLNNIGGQMVGTCNDPGNIAFDSGGIVRCVDPIATRIRGADIELAFDAIRLTVIVDDYTGRVSIQ